jgi:type I restriction enzyme S subunit
MNPAQLLTHFDRISEAPDAIPRLRQFLLELAVRGKLEDRDLRDEPVAELLKRILLAKEKRNKDGHVKKQEPLLQVQPEEAWFDIPPSWSWVRLGTIAQIVMGQSPPGETYNKKGEGIPLINGPVEFTEGPFGKTVINQYTTAPTNLCEEGDLLLCVRGSTTGRTNIAGFRACIGRGVASIRPFLTEQYVRLFIWRLRASIIAMGRGIAFPSVSRQQIEELPVPLPPLAEQQRIVAKVDELMALCDRLEAAQAERENRRDRLVATSLHRLNQPADDQSVFQEHARFYFNHLPRLATRLEHIQQLRQTIFNLAVRGKLVPQDPNEEPASELLKRIQAEKARLLKEGKIGSEKPPIPARADELAFELKPGWRSARISQILVELQTGPFGSSLHQSDYQRGGIPVVNPASIKSERLVPVESMAVGPKTLKRLSTFQLRTGDIVMARRGEMGRCAVVTKQENGWLCGTGSLILRLPEFVFPHFFVTLIGSPFVREYLGSSAVGATMQNLNQSILLNLVIGLPPLAEQHRIVAKVYELMALCDGLEAQLTTTQTESRRLLEVTLHHAISA